MKFTSAITSAALIAAASVNAQTAPDPAINTPSGVTTCQPLLLTFSGSHPPFIISAVPGGQPGAAPLEALGTSSGTSLTWNVDIAAGTYVGFHIVDAIGASQDSAAVTIIAGTDTSCIGKNGQSSSVSGSSTSAVASSSAASTSAAASTTSSAAVSSSSGASVSSVSSSSVAVSTSRASTSAAASSSSAASSRSTSAAASSTSSSNAAMPTQGSQWSVIALGVVGAAALL